jgi:hypothetical protein
VGYKVQVFSEETCSIWYSKRVIRPGDDHFVRYRTISTYLSVDFIFHPLVRNFLSQLNPIVEELCTQSLTSEKACS